MGGIRRYSWAPALLGLGALLLESGCASKAAELRTERTVQPIRTQSESRFVESVGRNRIRVVAFDFGGVVLGQCATPEGDLLWESCLPDSRAIAEGEKRTFSFLDGRAKDLNSGMFRQYSIQADKGGSLSGNLGGVASAKGEISVSRHTLVFEWRRYLLESLAINVDIQRPFVSAVEKGVAVRVVFDVTLRTDNGDLAASFGFGSLATALAQRQAEVEVGYEIIGTTMDILPDRATNITSVDGYIEAMNRFYDAVRRVSTAWRCYTEGQHTPPLLIRSDNGNGDSPMEHPSEECDPLGAGKQSVRDAKTFIPGILAYYVTGVRNDAIAETSSFMQGYLFGLRGTAGGLSCREMLDSLEQEGGDITASEPAQFHLGMQQSVVDVRGAGRWCTELKPSSKEQQIARTSLGKRG